MPQSSFFKLLSILTLITTSFQYGLIGSWQLVMSRRYDYINSVLTYQFNRDADANGNIISKLFIYDCFISQFLFEAQDNKISLNFQTSSILTDGCSIEQINQLRSLAKKIFFFRIEFDQLALLGLNGQVIFRLKRQKIDYSQIMVGAWLIFNSQQTGSSPIRINGSNIHLCQGQTQISYQIKTTNGSYPQLYTSLIANGQCKDAFFLNSFLSKLVFQVATNRTQLAFYDKSLKNTFSMNQIGILKANEALAVRTPPKSITSQPPQPSPSLSPSNVVSSARPSNINQPSPPSIQSSNIPIKQQQMKPQVQPPQLQTQPQIQPKAEVIQKKPEQTLIINSFRNQEINYDSMGSFSFDLSPTNQFSGSFSSSPIFSFLSTTPSYSNPSSRNQQTTVPPSTNSATEQTSLILTDGFFSGFGSTAQPNQQVKQQSQSTPPSNSLPAINKNGYRTITSIQVPINQFVLSNKWLLVWLNGVTNLPESLSRVYMIFTTTKIILYCPCNTYYSDYILQGNSLKKIKWTGTMNLCEVNRDNTVTNNVFYSNSVRQGGENLYFWFGSQAKLAQFRPYY